MTALRAVTIGDVLAETAQRFPGHPALIYQGRTINYGELIHQVCQAAKGLAALGVKKGVRVAVWETDRPNAVICLYALWMLGAVIVLPNTSLGIDEMRRLLSRAHVEILLYGKGYKDISFPEVVAKLPPIEGMRLAFFIGEEDGAEVASGMKEIFRVGENLSGEEFLKMCRCVSPEDAATLLFTSGTTGQPKGVLTSHYSRINSALCQADDLNAIASDRFLTAIPLFHCFSMTVNLLGSMVRGACLYLPKDRRTKTLLEGISVDRCTVLCAVPSLFKAMLARSDFDHYDLSSLRIGLVGGAMTRADEMRLFRERFAFELLPSLGQTEATGGITVASPQDSIKAKLETVGHFMEHIEGKIVDPYTGKTIPQGATGEIVVRGYCLMMGYDGLPGETQKVIDREGFLHTGDLGLIDQEGNVHLKGRLRKNIIRGGENIDPVEIENCLLDDARIQSVCVVGVPDAHYGEAVCACVVAEPGSSLDSIAVRQVVRARLAYYKVPKYVLFWDLLPEGEQGKRPLAAIREMAIEHIAGGERR